MPIRSFMGGNMGGPRDRGPGPRDRGPRGGGLFSGVRLFHGPIRFMFFGRPIFLSTGRQVGFLCGIVAFFVMLISTFAVFSNASSDKALRNDYTEQLTVYEAYNEIITNAKNGESGYAITTGLVEKVNTYYDYDYDYYYYSTKYYTLSYYFEANSSVYENETETIYTTYPNIVPDTTTIEIAYVISGDSIISIETEFTKTYNVDVPQIQARIDSLNSSIKTQTVAGVILIIIMVIIVALIILAIVKTIKKSKQKQALEDAKMKAEVEEAQAKAQEAQAQADMKHRYCTYCGAKFPEGDNKCPNCGSVHFDIRK